MNNICEVELDKFLKDNELMKEINYQMRQRSPLIWIVDSQEDKFIGNLLWLCMLRNKNVGIWSITNNIIPFPHMPLSLDPENNSHDSEIVNVWNSWLQRVIEMKSQASSSNPHIGCLSDIRNYKIPESVFVLFGFEDVISNPLIKRMLTNLYYDFKFAGDTSNLYHSSIILHSAVRPKLPEGMEEYIEIIEGSIPSIEETKNLVKDFIESKRDSNINIKVNKKTLDNISESLCGVTQTKQINILNRASVEFKTINDETPFFIQKKKEYIYKGSGYMNLTHPNHTMCDIGGLENLKDDMKSKEDCFSYEALLAGVPVPKGIVILGPPGSGKTAIANAIASEWGIVLVEVAIEAMFGGRVGETQSNVRSFFDKLRKIRKCVVLYNEIDKVFAGAGASANSDGGLKIEVFGMFLKELEKESHGAFNIFTSNLKNIDMIPKEIFRPGRIDMFYYTSLPHKGERMSIIPIHIEKPHNKVEEKILKEKRKIDSKFKLRNSSEFNIELLADNMEGYSGADIEKCIGLACIEAWNRKTKLTTGIIRETIVKIKPYADMCDEEMRILQSKVKNLQPASRPYVETNTKSKKKSIPAVEV